MGTYFVTEGQPINKDKYEADYNEALKMLDAVYPGVHVINNNLNEKLVNIRWIRRVLFYSFCLAFIIIFLILAVLNGQPNQSLRDDNITILNTKIETTSLKAKLESEKQELDILVSALETTEKELNERQIMLEYYQLACEKGYKNIIEAFKISRDQWRDRAEKAEEFIKRNSFIAK